VGAQSSDADLLRLIAEHDQAALAELFARHAGWLTLRLRRRTSDPDVVHDVLQDTFVAVWRSAGSYRGDGEVGGWLWGVAIRRLVSHYRKHPVPVPTAAEVLSVHAQLVTSAEDELLTAVEHGDVGQALSALSPELQETVRATVVDGLSTREAAALLGIPQGTVKSRLRAAKSQLRGHLMSVRQEGAL
jgi:RNA polymerase sigma factor (sigma-70 family)